MRLSDSAARAPRSRKGPAKAIQITDNGPKRGGEGDLPDKLQRPLPDGTLKIVVRGTKKDEALICGDCQSLL